MNALHVLAGNLFGGVERIAVTIARERAHASGVPASFAVFFDGRLSRELEEAGAKAHALGAASARKPWTVLAARRRLRDLCARERFPVVVFHGCWPHALLASAARRAGSSVVLWMHDAPSGRPWVEKLSRRAGADLAIANSEFTKNATRRVFPRIPCEVLRYPVPLEGPAPGARARLRRELGAGDDSVVLLLTARLERWKGHALLLDALSRLKDEPRWTAWIAGGPQRPREATYLAELERAAGELGLAARVRFLGERTDVRDLLAAADVHCQPNTGPEPFGVAFVEALAAGVPVVTTCMGGAVEIVDASVGALVEADAVSLARTLRALVTDDAGRKRLGERGPARARELCDPASTLAALARLLESVASPARTRAAVSP